MKTLYRIREGRMICGVCGGLAEYFNVDPNLIRLVALLFGFTGAGIIVYIIAAIILPEH